MSKSINIQRPKPASVDKWVEERKEPAKQVKARRLTVDIPIELHRRLKLSCVEQDRLMSEMVQELLEQGLQKASAAGSKTRE